MPRPPRCLEVLLGLSVVACAIVSFRSEIPERALVGTLQLTVGCLLLLSRPLKQSASPVQVACSLPALAAGAVGLAVAAPSTEWAVAAIALLCTGSTIAIVSLLTLGRSFGVLPAARKPVCSGPYRCIRHPAYVGQLLMLAACGFSQSTLLGIALPLACLPLLALRISAEERLLADTWSDYRDYMQRVRWRICPLLW